MTVYTLPKFSIKLNYLLIAVLCCICYSCSLNSTLSINKHDFKGRKKGIWILVSDTNTYIKVRYRKGNESGKAILYCSNGNVIGKGKMVNGMKEGIWECYNCNGELLGYMKFKGGKRLGYFGPGTPSL